MTIASMNNRALRPKSWAPTYTERDVVKGGIATKPIYREATTVATAVARQHEALGTPRSQWEPDENTVRLITKPNTDEASTLLAALLSSEADPVLDGMQLELQVIAANLDAVEAMPNPIAGLETGTTYTGAEAPDVHDEFSQEIRADILQDGKGIHARTPRALKVAGKWAPWIEGGGFLAFMVFYLNVPLLAPWQDWLGWTLAVTVVVYIILGQTWMVDLAGKNHNRAREGESKGNRHEAAGARGNRNRYLVGAGLAATAITSGLVLRGLASLGSADPAVTYVLVFLAVVTGLLMPCLSFLAVALDGSTISRERDQLAVDGEDDYKEQADLEDESKASLASIADGTDLLVGSIFPKICEDVQATVDQGHTLYNLVRAQIGGLEADPPTKTRRRFRVAPDGEPPGAEVLGIAFVGEITSGLPGAEPVDLLPLVERVRRLHAISEERGGLEERLAKVPPHPWTRSSQTG